MERCISDLDRIDSALLFGLVPFLHKVLLITLCPVGVEAGLLWANKALDILSFVLSQGRVSREPFPGSLYAVFVDFGERSSGIVRERRVHVHGQVVLYSVAGAGAWRRHKSTTSRLAEKLDRDVSRCLRDSMSGDG